MIIIVKVRKTFRFDEETIAMLDTLIPFLSSELNIKLDRTKVIEKLISERYELLLKGSESPSE